MKVFKTVFYFLCILILAQNSFAQSITLVQPNGGEVLYACETYPVQWTQTGTVSNYWNIDYSLDGGIIWTSVASNYLSTNGQFNWTVPNVQSSTVLMRVRDALNTTTEDTSDAVFTINIPITLISPNGGEVWKGRTVQNITWNAAGTSNSYTIQYSTDNGTNWNNLAIGYNSPTGTYSWTVPSMDTTTTCMVRVMDHVQNCMQDVSNAVFTIVPPDPVLTAPNSGTLRPLCNYNIRWITSSFISNVKLEYSLNNGSTWTYISTVPNTGSYSWVVPSTASTQCLVKATNSLHSNLYDISSSNFTITPPVEVTASNGGDTLYGCNNYVISWDKSNCLSNWNIYYSTDNGANWNTIATNVTNGSYSSQNYSWAVPNGINSSQCLIRVAEVGWGGRSDISDATFTILPSNSITVTSPNGGEVWQGLSTHPITWTHTSDASGQFRVEYSDDNGTSWSALNNGTSNNSYNWNVSGNPGTSYLVRVLDFNNTCRSDVSDANFTVTQPTPVLTAPNWGTLRPGCNYNITWNQATFSTSIKLEYSLDNGSSWNTIATVSNTGSYSWVVPSTASTQCLVRASHYNDPSVFDVSNSNFTIIPPVEVTTSNGGDTLYGCNNYVISWDKSNCLSNWNIYYSTDNGANWNTIATNINNSSYSSQNYSWTVPNGINSSQCLIRVAEVGWGGRSDISDATFTILPSNSITVTSPNGGEVWQGLSTHPITWTHTSDASGQFRVEYSDDNGTSWSALNNGTSNNSYNWNVSGNPGTSYLVRVLDFNNTCRSDVSDANFTVTQPTPVLTAPNWGTLRPGCNYNIRWNQATFSTSIKLEYSLDNGSSWNTIATVSNTGSYSWVVPSTASTQCLVRASHYNDPSVFDVSNSNFTIIPPVEVTASNGGDTLYGCNNYVISWDKSNCLSNWNIYYSTDNGANWNTIATNINNSSYSSQNYSWAVPNGINSSQCLIRVAEVGWGGRSDISDATFTILPSNSITVTSPNGGEVWQGLSTHPITWTHTSDASGQFRVEYSDDNGTSWSALNNGTSNNSYNWNVPGNPGTSYLVRVLDFNNTCRSDVSDANFTVTQPTPVLTAPNWGTLRPGCNYNIRWNQATFSTSIKLEYSLDNGSSWNTIATVSNTGSYSWVVPSTPSTQCLVRASHYNDPSVFDVSNSNFTIIPPVEVTASNGGDTLYGCNNYVISWDKSNCLSNWNIYYSTDNGANWNTIATNINNSNYSSQNYSWAVPNGINSSQCLIRVAEVGWGGRSDISDATFTILPSNSITVTSPNGGEVWQGLSTHPITWTHTSDASGQFRVEYSDNNGSSWSALNNGTSNNSYNWNLPGNPGTSYLVRVLDFNNTCRSDVSDANFTITQPTPVLTAPNWGTLRPGCNYNIRWDQSTFSTSIKLEYSLDNGSSWNTIATVSNTGSYSWVVPSTPSTQCLVRASHYNDPSVFDVSNSNFTIIPPVEVTASNGGDTLYGCNNYVISWDKSNCLSNWNIYYSTDNGANWNTIATNINNSSYSSQNYSWTVPNGISSSQCLIRVAEVGWGGRSDISDATFTILPSNSITVTSPNGGEVWQGLSTHPITWTHTSDASGQFRVEYSDNNGTSWSALNNGTSNNSYNWNVPNNPGTSYLVRVLDFNNTCRSDVSDANFTVSPSDPVLTAPNGGQTLYSGTTYNITWLASTFFSSYVKLEYSLDNGATWNYIGSVSNTGSESWTIPNVYSTQCLVRASNSTNLSLNDVSYSVFTIKPAVTLLTPNGDNGTTIWGGCTVTSITIDRSPAWNSYEVEYSLDNGSNWTTITSNWTTNANPATYNWTMPNTQTNQAMVRVRPNFTSFSDRSDSTFTITKPVTIIQPNFGGVMTVGNVYNISWSSDGISNIYDIFYSTNGGATYTNIVTGYTTSTNTYAWTIPNTLSNNCVIWVRDNINHCKEDISDQLFTISSGPQVVQLLAPNGIGDTLVGCHTKTIRWTDLNSSGSYSIDYSVNSGATWINIASGSMSSNLIASTNYSYDWIVPNNISSNNVLLRVRSLTTPTLFDLSDAFFSVINGSLSVTPTDTSACYAVPIQLNVTGGEVNNYSWSPSIGLDSSNSASPIAAPYESTNYVVQCTNGTCILTDSIMFTVTFDSSIVSDVTISASVLPTDTVCAGTAITYTATATNEGTSPIYQWRVNGVNVGSNAATFTTSSLNNNDVVTCILYSNMPCVSGSPDTSNALVASILPNVTPSVTWSTTPHIDTICDGVHVTFTAIPNHGGTTPSYQWFLNGSTVGNNGSFSSSTLNSGDILELMMSSTASCVTNSIATSTDTINVKTVPAQPLSITGAPSICTGTSASYTIPLVNHATSYTWTLPSGWTGSSTTDSISVTANSNSGIISVTANNACGVSSAAQLNITANLLPVVTFSSLGVVCENTPAFVLTGGSPIGGIYSGIGVTNDSIFTPTAVGNGLYTITYTYTDSFCTNSDTSTIQVDMCAGTIGSIENEAISVYPNPLKDYTVFYFDASIQFENIQIQIFDVLGREVKRIDNIRQNKVTLRRNNLENGVYYYRVMNQEKEIKSGELIFAK
ncbi:T9SS type A sorting domain-containing protein [Aureispira anguillae]|uniref:T9SS type A sorting domain-containing protein n=1 Tax=Aureispira anguillae TaxID=2864201 RepID=A0A915YEX2_9BACT|nr:T9SS type A sorting domain-containing protein [Aureispira anguillae]BDS11782.1 T9SS type A sorting domain-containing protein [Aureispira anguillae]